MRLLPSFKYDNGARAIVGSIAFMVIVVGLLISLSSVEPELFRIPRLVTAPVALTREGIFFAIVILSTLSMALIEQRSVWSFGLSGPRNITHFGQGLAFGGVCLFFVIACLIFTQHLSLHPMSSQIIVAMTRAPLWAFCFCLVAITEELLFRGYLQTTLARWLGFWPAAAVLSLAFGLIHLRNGGEGVLGIAVVILGGALFSLFLKRTGSLWLGIGFHTAWDFGQSYVFGTPDSGILIEDSLFRSQTLGSTFLSGGSVGPEGSVFIVPVFAAALGLTLIVMRASTR